MPDLSAVLNMTAEEALAYWRRKVPVTKQDFDALTQEMQALAFTASGVHRLEDLQAISDAIGRAIANGTTLDQFRSEVGDLLKNRRHHIETVFRTNTQTAYNVGRYKRQMETAGDLPYWRYSAVNDSRTRPTHRAMHGRVWPANHPVWDTWYPPNGYRCRCSVIAMTARQVERMGLKVETIDPTHELIEPIAPNGERMPGRPLIPDQGFGFNPAKEVWRTITPSELDGEMIIKPIAGICFSECERLPLPEIDRLHIVELTTNDLMPQGLKDEEYVKAFLREFGVNEIEGATTITIPKTNYVLPINKYFFIDKRDGSWKVKKNGRELYMRPLAWTIQNPYEVWLTPTEISNNPYLTIRMLRIFELNGEIGGFCVFSLTTKGWQASTAFMPKLDNKKAMFEYIEKQRKGFLLYREEF